MLQFKEFLKQMNLELLPNTSVDISHLNKNVMSFNHTTNQKEPRQILKVIRKPNAPTYVVNTTTKTLECSLDHQFATMFGYKTVEQIIEEGYHTLQILTDIGYENIEAIVATNKSHPIYDLEVEGNHNLFTNNLLSHNSMGDPTTVSGGKAIPFYAHCRVRITRSEIDRENEQNVMKFTIIKNKMAAPFKVGTVVFKWNKGFDFFSEVGQLAIELGIITKDKNTYSLPETDVKLIGKKKIIEYLADNEDYTKLVIQPKVVAILETKTDNRIDEINENELY